MSILDKMKQNGDEVTASSPSLDIKLTKQEIEWVLNLIKDSTFRGSELEQVYNTVYKLQQQFLNQ
jgi:hypothetical protein